MALQAWWFGYAQVRFRCQPEPLQDSRESANNRPPELSVIRAYPRQRLGALGDRFKDLAARLKLAARRDCWRRRHAGTPALVRFAQHDESRSHSQFRSTQPLPHPIGRVADMPAAPTGQYTTDECHLAVSRGVHRLIHGAQSFIAGKSATSLTNVTAPETRGSRKPAIPGEMRVSGHQA